MRVLAVASAKLAAAAPERARDLPLELEADRLRRPLARGVRQPRGECGSAGTEVTNHGDHPETARAIAAQAGIEQGRPWLARSWGGLDEPALPRAHAGAFGLRADHALKKLRIVSA